MEFDNDTRQYGGYKVRKCSLHLRLRTGMNCERIVLLECKYVKLASVDKDVSGR